ncbi:CD177 antigen, partial [Lemmus lemmus]
LPIPGVPALKCQRGKIEAVRNASELPLEWKTGEETCEVGEGCQDLLMLLENGPDVNLVFTKGCTADEDHKPRIIQHRTGPSLSIISYTHVCRHWDFCNDLSSTHPLWIPPPVTGPGSLRCPRCLSKDGCPQNAPEQVCPAGSLHCYNGVLSLRGGGLFSDLNVQGCMSQPGCDLLNGTQTIGPIDIREDCSPQLGALACYKGVMLRFGTGFAKEAIEWSAPSTQVCEPEELCQETLLLIDVGPRTLLIGSKGCTGHGAENSGVSIYSRLPGMLVASYTRFCSSNLCNEANSSSVLLSSLPRPSMGWGGTRRDPDIWEFSWWLELRACSAPQPFSLSSDVPPPGDLQCPVCAEFFGSCFQNTNFVTCPQGTTRCYKGDIELQGGECWEDRARVPGFEDGGLYPNS